MNIVITGGTGFIGQAIADLYIKAGHHVFVTGHEAPVPGADYLLEVDQVRKEFPGVVALDNVTLRIRPGTVHALMGENGAGKSTLMKIIAGVYQPDAGEMRLKGQPIRIKTPLDALEAGIAMIHQELNLMPFMTVAETTLVSAIIGPTERSMPPEMTTMAWATAASAIGSAINPRAVKEARSARMVQSCGFGFGCCWQFPNGAFVASGSAAAPCWVLAMMKLRTSGGSWTSRRPSGSVKPSD